jgi:spermidine/putrescine transport system substrate-binding protein
MRGQGTRSQPVDSDNLASTPISRRTVLAGGALAGVAAFLAACGTKGTAATAAPPASEAPASVAPVASATNATESAAPSVAAEPVATPSAELNWANWTYYMDVDPNDQTIHPTLDGFTAKYGTKVNYQEVIDGNDEFVAKISDAIKANKDTGWDLITLTDWMAAKLIRRGWVEAFDPANVPNLTANLKDVYRNLDWDLDNSHHAPWRSGTTGVGFNSETLGDVTSLAALYTVDPKTKGKVEYLTEMRDAVGLSMLYLGLDPAKPTRADCDAACALMQKAKDEGVIRDVKGQSYTTDLTSGDAVLAMAWSGDMPSATIDNPALRFSLATEGGMLWTDNLMIPNGAAHKGTAELLINYYYDPVVNATLTAGVDYISPVKGTDEIMIKANPDAAKNQFVIPPPDWIARFHIFGALSEEDELYFNQQFAKVIGVG